MSSERQIAREKAASRYPARGRRRPPAEGVRGLHEVLRRRSEGGREGVASHVDVGAVAADPRADRVGRLLHPAQRGGGRCSSATTRSRPSKSGEVIGESALKRGKLRGATVTTTGRAEVLHIDRDDLHRLLEDVPAMRQLIDDTVARRTPGSNEG